MRHAKSDWATKAQTDFERPLIKRGRGDLPRMARLLEAAGPPDLIISSTAQRARETAEGVAESMSPAVDITYAEDLYLAPPSALTRVLGTTPSSVQFAVVIAHNPGVEEWATSLSGARLTMPTAAVVELQLRIPRWNAITDGCAELKWMVVPRLLKALENL